MIIQIRIIIKATLLYPQSTLMKLLFWIMVCLFLVKYLEACETSRYIPKSKYDCTFYMTYNNNSTCTNFTFNRCQYTFLCSNNSCPPDNSTFWSLCTARCCDPFENYDLTSSSLDKCVYYNSDAKIIIIACSVVGAVILFIAVLLVCYHCVYKKGHCCVCDCDFPFFNFFRRGNQQQIHAPPPQIYPNYGHHENNYPRQYPSRQQITELSLMERPFQNIEWKNEEKEVITNIEKTCAVCLASRPNMLIDCHHLFHAKCLFECFKKKVECILCRNHSFKLFKIYCSRCFVKYYEVKPQHLGIVADNKVNHCEDCKFLMQTHLSNE